MWGSPGFYSPSSVSRISGGSLIGDLLCGSQSLSDVAKGEWDPLFSSSFLQTKHPHAGYTTSPWGLYCILPLSQPSIAAAAHICPGLSFLLFTLLVIHANMKRYFSNMLCNIFNLNCLPFKKLFYALQQLFISVPVEIQ